MAHIAMNESREGCILWGDRKWCVWLVSYFYRGHGMLKDSCKERVRGAATYFVSAKSKNGQV